MGNFSQKCRNVLVGFAIVVAIVLSVWLAGWLTNDIAHYVGIFPYKWESCGLGHFCSTGINNGAETTLEILLFGVVTIFVIAGNCIFAKYVFLQLEKLGRKAIRSVKECRA